MQHLTSNILFNYSSHSAEPRGALCAVPGPVYYHCLAFDKLEIDIAPIPAVVTLVPVVTHDENLAHGDKIGAEIVPRFNTVYGIIRMLSVWFNCRLAVHKDHFILLLDNVAFDADDP